MANAVVQARYYETEGTTGASAEGGLKFNKEAGLTATAAPIPIPTATGTRYSWHKPLALHVTTAASPATAITDRTAKMSGALLTGLGLFFKANASYAAPANIADDNVANVATPAGYTAMTETAQVYHAASVSAGATGRNGSFCETALGVGSNYAGDAGTNVDIGAAARSVVLGYTEA